METLITFLFTSLVTFFFVRQYLKKLAAPKSAAAKVPQAIATPPASPRTAITCPRCSKSISSDSTFCQACGAPLALWNVHRAAVKPATNGSAKAEEGKPRPMINASLCIGCGTCVDSCPETGTLALVQGKAILAHPERCVGHADCVRVCPTSAIALTFGSALQTLRAPFIKEDFETNLPGIYIAGELSGVGLIKTAINEGRLAIDSIRRRLEAQGGWQPPVVTHGENHGIALEGLPYDVIIVGAGPAGLSASLAAMQDGLRYLTLEQGEVAATIRNYPRHKFLMAEPLEMPLIGSLYVGDGTKESLLSVWETILANTGVQIQTQERVEGIMREGSVFSVTTGKNRYQTRNIVLALGKRGSPRRLSVAGEDLGKVTYRLIEADSYENKDIVVVGGGDSAVEAALALSKAGRNRVALSYRSQSFSRTRERNQKLLHEAEEQGRIRVLRGSVVMEILPESVKLDVLGEMLDLRNDYVFIMIGGESPEAFLQKIGIEIVEKVIGAETTYEAFA
jgi:thioredoxin reductase (NADPH)